MNVILSCDLHAHQQIQIAFVACVMDVTKQKAIQDIFIQIRLKKKDEIRIREPPNTSFLPYAQTYLLAFLTVFIIQWTNDKRCGPSTESKQKPTQTDFATAVNHMNYDGFNYANIKMFNELKSNGDSTHQPNCQLKSFKNTHDEMSWIMAGGSTFAMDAAKCAEQTSTWVYHSAWRLFDAEIKGHIFTP